MGLGKKGLPPREAMQIFDPTVLAAMGLDRIVAEAATMTTRAAGGGGASGAVPAPVDTGDQTFYSALLALDAARVPRPGLRSARGMSALATPAAGGAGATAVKSVSDIAEALYGIFCKEYRNKRDIGKLDAVKKTIVEAIDFQLNWPGNTEFDIVEPSAALRTLANFLDVQFTNNRVKSEDAGIDPGQMEIALTAMVNKLVVYALQMDGIKVEDTSSLPWYSVRRLTPGEKTSDFLAKRTILFPGITTMLNADCLSAAGITPS